MDNAQVMSKDGTWFLFADWQGVTRLQFPGDKVKTDCGLDRPYETKPLVLRPSGLVWSMPSVDLEPATLKKIRPAASLHDSPDPLDGAPIKVEPASVTVGGAVLPLVPHSEEIDLGAVEGRTSRYRTPEYDLFQDGSLLLFAHAAERPCAAFVARAEGGAGRVAWCRPVRMIANATPQVFRDAGSSWLADRDFVLDVAHLAQISDDGATLSSSSAPAVAGPWVFEGRVWWQPDAATVAVGPSLGRPETTYTLPAAHAGPGRLLRVRGRRLFIAWHGLTILDLEPVKKGKGEISRKHKAAHEAMYDAAERLLRPVREGLAPREVRAYWHGCTRTTKRAEPMLTLSGRSDGVTHAISYALQDGGKAKMAPYGCTGVGHAGGTCTDLAAPMTGEDVRAAVAILDAAGLSRASGLPYLQSLYEGAKQRNKPPPFTPEAESLLLAAVVSGLRGEGSIPLAPVTAADLAAVAPLLGNDASLRAAGISNCYAGILLAVAGHRRMGAEAAEPVLGALSAIGPSFAQTARNLCAT